jgi:DHA2 family metal-tetracycline-proton antiporter-like MFS transporter
MEIEVNDKLRLLRVLVFVLIFSVMNAFLFNVALPVIRDEFSLTTADVSWILSSYMVIYAIGTVVYGKLADYFSLSRLLTYGLLLLAFGSIIGIFAIDFRMVIVSRILQAAGAAVIPTISMLIPARFFAEEERGKALGTIAVGMALGTALGPVVSGIVSEFSNWRLLFGLSVLPLITIPYFKKYLPKTSKSKKAIQLDYAGAGLLSLTVALLLLGITQARLVYFVIALFLLAIFIVHIHKHSNPFVTPRLFTNKAYSLMLVITFFTASLLFALTFATPLLLNDVHQLSQLSIGLVLFPSAILAALLGKRGGKLADKKGNGYLFYLSAGLLSCCYVLLSIFVETEPIWIMFILIFGNVGATFIRVALSNAISRTLPPDSAGIGMGFFTMFNFIAGAAATSMIGAFLEQDSSFQVLQSLVYSDVATGYSNLFLILTLIAILISVAFARISKSKKSRSYLST